MTISQRPSASVRTLGNKFGTSPVIKKLFMISRKVSSFISASVSMNVAVFPSCPHFLYRALNHTSVQRSGRRCPDDTRTYYIIIVQRSGRQ